MPDFEKMAGEVVAAAKGFVDRAMAGLTKRVDEIESMVLALPAPKEGPSGKSAYQLAKEAAAWVHNAKPEDFVWKSQNEWLEDLRGKDGKDGRDGKDADHERIIAELTPEISRLFDAIPLPKDGEPGPAGKDGKNADPQEVVALLQPEIARQIEALPKPRDGREGRDGLPGVPGKDGEKGADGKDGLGLEDFDVKLADDGRTFLFRFARGDLLIEREVKTAIPLHKGVWQEREYERGDMVTRDGSTWHCEATTSETPGNGATNWKLVVKRGNHGKDGKDGVGIQGKEGRPGRDLTQMTFDGVKY